MNKKEIEARHLEFFRKGLVANGASADIPDHYVIKSAGFSASLAAFKAGWHACESRKAAPSFLRDHCFRALACLHIATDAHVANDVNSKVQAYIAHLEGLLHLKPRKTADEQAS